MQLKNVTVEEYEFIWGRVDAAMKRYAAVNYFQEFEDYNVHWPYNGWSQILIEIFNLEVLSARLVRRLRRQVIGQPGWEVVIAIAVKKHWDEWPRMGIRIRENEVIDDLKRECFPVKFQSLAFEGARIGTAADQE